MRANFTSHSWQNGYNCEYGFNFYEEFMKKIEEEIKANLKRESAAAKRLRFKCRPRSGRSSAPMPSMFLQAAWLVVNGGAVRRPRRQEEASWHAFYQKPRARSQEPEPGARSQKPRVESQVPVDPTRGRDA